MMEQIKTGMKLIKYSHGLKSNIAVGVIFGLFGVLLLFVGEAGMPMAILFITMTPLMVVQMSYSLLFSSMVVSSAQRRLLEIKLPDLVSLVSSVLTYVVAVVAEMIYMHIRPEMTAQCMSMLLSASIIEALILVYMGAAYKFYLASFFLFMLGFIMGMDGGEIMFFTSGVEYHVTTVIVTGLVIVLVGVGISALLRRILYKRPLSKMAVGASLRKALQ